MIFVSCFSALQLCPAIPGPLAWLRVCLYFSFCSSVDKPTSPRMQLNLLPNFLDVCNLNPRLPSLPRLIRWIGVAAIAAGCQCANWLITSFPIILVPYVAIPNGPCPAMPRCIVRGARHSWVVCQGVPGLLMPWKPELSIPGVLRLRRNLHSGYVAQLSAGIRMAPCNIPPNKRARESHTYKVHERKAQGSLSLPPLANKHHFFSFDVTIRRKRRNSICGNMLHG